MAEAISPLLDNAPVSLRGEQGLLTQVRKQWAAFSALLQTGKSEVWLLNFLHLERACSLTTLKITYHNEYFLKII